MITIVVTAFFAFIAGLGIGVWITIRLASEMIKKWRDRYEKQVAAEPPEGVVLSEDQLREARAKAVLTLAAERIGDLRDEFGAEIAAGHKPESA